MGKKQKKKSKHNKSGRHFPSNIRRQLSNEIEDERSEIDEYSNDNQSPQTETISLENLGIRMGNLLSGSGGSSPIESQLSILSEHAVLRNVPANVIKEITASVQKMQKEIDKTRASRCGKASTARDDVQGEASCSKADLVASVTQKMKEIRIQLKELEKGIELTPKKCQKQDSINCKPSTSRLTLGAETESCGPSTSAQSGATATNVSVSKKSVKSSNNEENIEEGAIDERPSNERTSEQEATPQTSVIKETTKGKKKSANKTAVSVEDSSSLCLEELAIAQITINKQPTKKNVSGSHKASTSGTSASSGKASISVETSTFFDNFDSSASYRNAFERIEVNHLTMNDEIRVPINFDPACPHYRISRTMHLTDELEEAEIPMCSNYESMCVRGLLESEEEQYITVTAGIFVIVLGVSYEDDFRIIRSIYPPTSDTSSSDNDKELYKIDRKILESMKNFRTEAICRIFRSIRTNGNIEKYHIKEYNYLIEMKNLFHFGLPSGYLSVDTYSYKGLKSHFSLGRDSKAKKLFQEVSFK